MPAFDRRRMPAAPPAVPSKRKPLRVVTVPPTAFAQNWEKRPERSVEIGLRLIAEADMTQARGEASRRAWQMHPEEQDADNRVDAFNDFLMAWAVACAATDPEDVEQSYFGSMAQDVVGSALQPHGVRLIFEELQTLIIETSPLCPPATPDDVAYLQSRMTDGSLERLQPATRNRVLRELRHALDQVRAELG